ncbi:tetraspanin-32 [Rhinophrynus dorsalis]
MGQQQLWVRSARCQLLVSLLFIMLLALAVCVMTIMTMWGRHFTVLTNASSPENPVRGLHYAMVLYGGSVCALLLFIIFFTSVSVLRDSQQFMGIAFLGFSCLLCALMAGLAWTHEGQSQVDNSLLDVYDNIYEQVLRGPTAEQREYLLYMHEMLQCCGKIEGTLKVSETQDLCQSTADRQDCISVISSALQTHWRWVTALMLLSLGFAIYGTILSSLLFFSLPRGTHWGRRGEYSLTKALNHHSAASPDTPLTQLFHDHPLMRSSISRRTF